MEQVRERTKSILLVEDDAIVALAEKKVLEAEGYEVQVASNGETAVEYIRENTIPLDLILMDIDLGPGMDGTEAAQKILDIRSVPILFLTSHTEREYVIKAEGISSYGYVVKHTGDLVLIASVKMAFRLAEANKRIARELEDRIRAEEAQRRSEFRLKRAELTAKLGNCELDLTTGKITGSEGAARIYGLTGTEIPYEEVKKIPLPQFCSLLDKALKELIEEGKPYDVEFQIRAADTGELKDIHAVASYEKDQRTVFGVIQDVTAQKRIEQALRDAETLFRFALEGAGHGVWDWHIPSNRVYFSPQWKRMLGYGEEEIENRYEAWETRVHPEDLPKALQAIQDLLSHRVEWYQCEYRLRCKNGSYRWVLDRGKVMEWGADGKAIRAVGTHTDITERMEAEERIQLLLKEKELLLRETHHRILNNLSVIRSLLSLQVSKVSSPEAEETLREAQGRIDAMRVLYERLFRSKILKAVSAHSYLEDFVRDIREIFSTRGRVEITVEGEDVSLSPRQAVPLGIIVNELISNALKYAFPGKRAGNILVRLQEKDRKLQIELRDDGVGFPEANQSSDGVFRLACGTQSKDSPLPEMMQKKGFGLELVSVLVEQLEGSCVLESRAGAGSRFLLEFTLDLVPGAGS